MRKFIKTTKELEEFGEAIFSDDKIEIIACDIETTEFDDKTRNPIQMKLHGIGIYAGEEHQCYICHSEEIDYTMFNQLIHFSKPFVFHNAKFDLEVLLNLGIIKARDDLPIVHDTMLMSFAEDENKQRHGLKYLAKDLLKEEDIVKYGDVGKKPEIDINSLFQDENQLEKDIIEREIKMGNYCIDDCRNTYNLYFYFKKSMLEQDEAIRKEYVELELPFLKVLIDMELRGISIDKSYLKELELKVEDKLVDTGALVYKLAGKQFDINSPQQLSKVLFEDFKYEIPDNYKTPKGDASTDATTLKYLVREKNSEIAQALLTYKELSKLQSAFIKGLPKLEIDGIIHTSFNQIGAVTGRLSSSSPNCLSMDTEILTKNGWKGYFDLSEGQEVVTFNKDSGLLERGEIESLYRGTDEIMHFESQHMSWEVTPNHRCLFQDRKNGKYIVKEAKDYLKDAKILHGEVLKGGEEDDDNFLKLLVAIQADGNYNFKKIDFIFTKRRKVIRLKELLNALNINFTETIKGSGTRIRFTNIDDKGYLIDKIFTYKRLSLSERQRRLFIDELFYWDGLCTRKNEYVSKYLSNIEVIQAVSSTLGIRCHRKTEVNKGKYYYRAYFTFRNYSLTSNVKVVNIGKKEIWCCKVKNSFILVKRLFDTFITGNCQQIPRRADELNIRKAFKPRDGYVFVDSDFSQIELRLMAYLSQDPTMLSIYAEGGDIHQKTADLVGTTRQNSKSLNFGIIYGMSCYGLAEQIKVSKEEAQKFIDNYLNNFSGVKDYIQKVINTVKKNKFINTITKRRRRFPKYKQLEDFKKTEKREQLSDYDKLRYRKGYEKSDKEMERQAVNSSIQGSAGDLMKVAMRNMYQKLKPLDAHLLLQIHDEVIVECPKESAEKVKEIVKYEMENAIKFPGIDIIAEPKISEEREK